MGALATLLRPDSVAVVGANDDPSTYGGRVWRFLRRDFHGLTMAVNRRPGAVEDAVFAQSLGELPQVPDVVVVVAPAQAVVGVLEEAGGLGVRAGVVLSRDVVGAEDHLRALAERTGMVLLGPNCLGLINANGGVSLSSSISLEAPPRHGPLALVAQSGALMGTLHAHATETGIGLGLCVSTGSQAVVRVEDVLLELVEDPQIETVGVYAEDIDPMRFREAVAALKTRGATVIVLKGGLTARGSLVTASHSGALASDGRAFRQLAGELGVVTVADPGELLTTMALAARAPRRWLVATVSGGLSAIAVDQAAFAGIELPEPAREPFADVGLKPPYNPLDLDASETSEEEKAAAIAALAADDVAEAVLVVVNDMPGLEPFLERLQVNVNDRVVLCSECSAQFATALRTWVREGGWYTTGLAQTMRALGKLSTEAPPSVTDDRRVDESLLPPVDLIALLQEQGVPVLPLAEVWSEEEAVRAAAELGYPVVVKVARAAHRGDAIRIGLTSPGGVMAAVAEFAEFAPLLVQPLAPPGLEFYMGVFRDPTFGWQLIVGAGGASLEDFGDVAVVPADYLERGIEDILERTATGRWLLGGVGRTLLSLEGLTTTAKGLLRAADALGTRLIALDLNPIVVHDGGVVVVDAKARIASAQAPTARPNRTEGLSL